MTPPNWHQKIFELARLRFSELPLPQDLHSRLLFIKHGEIHCRMFFSNGADADKPSQSDYLIWKRIADIKDTPAEAYAVASLVIGMEP
ncbi:MAG TPA: hypothetical protein VG347_08400 [Verrucomicrobiae bacterium]|nr:hypothetical protein [Verrucomicrobiae bacterium]